MDQVSVEAHVAAILNDFWMVRHCARGGRTGVMREQRRLAIHQLGLTIRRAFSSCNDFEPLIAAVVNGGRPKDYDPPF